MFKKIVVWMAIGLGILSVSPAAQAAGTSKIDVVLFTAPYCGHCQRLKREYLQEFKNTFSKRVNLIEYDITQPGNNIIFSDTLDEAGAEMKGVPALVVGKRVLMGYPSQIKTDAAQAIDQAIKNKERTFYGTKEYIAKCKLPPAPQKEVQESKPVSTEPVVPEGKTSPEPSPTEPPAQEPCSENPVVDGSLAARAFFEQITWVAIVVAGLIDGINPCAFAVIVFFISFLAAYKYNRREVILVGGAYCFSVFTAYILIGLGLFNFLYAMRSFYYVMMVFKWLTIGLCALFLLLSIYDFIIYTLTKDHTKIISQLPKSYKEYIHKVMRLFLKDKQGSAWRLVAAATCVGFVVSLVEAICTGQVYLPTIALILKEAGQHFWRAMLYLVLYNLMFIVPLIVILVLSIIGYESSRFNGFFKKHLGLTKLLLALLFLGLLLLLIFNM